MMAYLANNLLNGPLNLIYHWSANKYTNNFSEAQAAYIKSQVDTVVTQVLLQAC
jgi:hypothetical protein